MTKNTQSSDVAGSRVLLVEDDASSREAMLAVLGRAGYETRSAASFEEGLKVAEVFGPQILVVDWLLPDGTGLQLANRVRAANPSAAVVFLSGFSCEELRAEACHLQPAAILRKPVTGETLREAMEKAVGFVHQ